MKKIISVKVLLILSILVLFTGCDKYLEESPDNRVELNTLSKASQLLTSAYSNGGYNFTEWMSDNVSFTFGTTRLPEHNEAYTWSDIPGINQDTPTNFWNSSYEAISHSNEVLAVVDNLPGDEANRNAVKGEALLTRAYNHFMLVNLFAKHYESLGANRDPGIPYVEEPERNFVVQYTRNSVEEVYLKIERDLLQGLELINDNYYSNSGKYHFTRDAALAFASRFYLFKGDDSKCIDYSSRLLANDPAVYVKDIQRLLQERVNIEDYIRLYTSPNDNSNLLLIRKITNFHVNVGHWPTNEIYSALYRNNPWGLTDERSDPAFIRGENGIGLPKFEFLFERSSLTSNVGLNYTIVVAFRGEEVLLNRAECYAIQNRLDLALADLQVLANKRYRGDAPVTLEVLREFYGAPDASYDQIIVLDYIMNERRKEFLHEGLRWFDVKRYKIPVEHATPTGEEIVLAEDDLRKVLQIPQAAIDVGGLKRNPR